MTGPQGRTGGTSARPWHSERVDVWAAGAVVWREGGEIALVHRPRYDDWSLPKGKLNPGETMPFAAVREGRKRASDQRLFDVQMMGGIVLHEGDIAEMKTGEGKTYVASLALYVGLLVFYFFDMRPRPVVAPA